MRLRLLTIIAAMLLVTACTSTTDSSGSVSGDGQGTGGKAGINRADVTPGTQDDLVLNVGDRVFFEYDRYDLNSESKSTLERQATWLKKFGNLKITIEGHADERGTREYNLALGERRAIAVKDYLVSLGIPAGRLETISFGKERPAVLGSDESSWTQNRRSVTTLKGASPTS
jgi:peptidoglycan-associated lipoprotein